MGNAHWLADGLVVPIAQICDGTSRAQDGGFVSRGGSSEALILLTAVSAPCMGLPCSRGPSHSAGHCVVGPI